MMATTFKRIVLNHTHLAQVMGKSAAEVQTVLQHYLDQNSIVDFESYTFEMVIKQNGIKNVLYVAYASIPDYLKSSGEIKVIPLKVHDFLECEIAKSDVESFMDGGFNDDLNEYMKDNNLKGDLTSVFALIQDKNTHMRVLFPYKTR
jgi:hypothetical protein